MVLFVSLLPHTNGKHINPPIYFRPISDKRGKISLDMWILMASLIVLMKIFNPQQQTANGIHPATFFLRKKLPLLPEWCFKPFHLIKYRYNRWVVDNFTRAVSFESKISRSFMFLRFKWSLKEVWYNTNLSMKFL